jgi:RimJ/RimL family protein N-acetyltransferase
VERKPRGSVRLNEIVVFGHALTEPEWDKVRAFVRRTNRESLRLRFGQAADFADDHTLKRFFDIEGGRGEMIWMLEEGGAICAIAHLVRSSPAQAEIALIVRSDRARRGIGEELLRTTLARAARHGLDTVSALVLCENTGMLRLARKVGFEPRKSSGLAVELELDLGQIRDTGRPLMPGRQSTQSKRRSASASCRSDSRPTAHYCRNGSRRCRRARGISDPVTVAVVNAVGVVVSDLANAGRRRDWRAAAPGIPRTGSISSSDFVYHHGRLPDGRAI